MDAESNGTQQGKRNAVISARLSEEQKRLIRRLAAFRETTMDAILWDHSLTEALALARRLDAEIEAA